jgi:hypothetical protein
MISISMTIPQAEGWGGQSGGGLEDHDRSVGDGSEHVGNW